MEIAEILKIVMANPFVSALLVLAGVLLLVSSIKVLGITRIGPIIMSNNKINIMVEVIRNITKLEVERQVAPDHARGECRRIVKDASDQTRIILRKLYAGEDFRALDTLLAGQVNTYIVSEVMAIVEKNHIAEMDRDAWNVRKGDEFRTRLAGLEAVLLDYWPKDDVLTAKEVHKRLEAPTIDIFYVWDRMFERIRSISVDVAEREAVIDTQINKIMSYYQKTGKLPQKVL